MNQGKWLMPRYTSKDIFDKDYPTLNLSGISVKCPGCGEAVQLSRKNNAGRSAGWCRKCGRGVAG